MDQIKLILGEVLKHIEEKHKSQENFKDNWEKCVTKKISKHTKITYFKKGELFVNVENSAWLCELRNNKEKILDKLKKSTKEKIKDIRFKVGEIYG